MQNKKILLITSSYPFSQEDPRAAAGVFIKDFAEELAKRTEVIVLTQNRNQNDLMTVEADLKVMRFGWSGNTQLSILRFPRDLLLILSVIFKGISATVSIGRKNKICFTLACWAIPSGLWALCLKCFFKIPYAVWCLGSDVWDFEKHPIKRFLLRQILRQADALYADGYQLKNSVISISGKKCSFLPSTRIMPGQVKVKAEIKPDKKNYLFIGRYHPNKGPDILLKAISELDTLVRGKVHFHFFGGGPIQADLEKFIQKKDISDIVTLQGYINESRAAAFLKACEALIIPSRIESIPVIFSDALQCNTPIIATDVGDMGWLLRKYRGGIVVYPESPAAMAEAIGKDVLQNDDFSKGRKQLLDQFDLSKAVEKFISDISCRLS